MLKTNPNSPSAWRALAENYYQLGRYDEAVAAQKSAIGARGNPATNGDAGRLERSLCRRATTAAAMRRLAEVREARNQDWAAAQDFIRAGLLDRALDTLERLYETRDQNLAYISVAPIFDPIRSHPRFRALLKKMNLPSA